jgi:hypothetical protein
MALIATDLASLMFQAHIVEFPEAIEVIRENTDTGVPPHNPMQQFTLALCEGYVAALANGVIRDVGEGDEATPGTAAPVPFTLTQIPFAVTCFISLQGWNGENSLKMANILIGNLLTYTQLRGLLYMTDNRYMGNGTGIVSPQNNPDLQAALEREFNTQFNVAFSNSGFFSEADVPGEPVNATLAAQLKNYATALAIGVASIVAEVNYTGGLPTGSVSGVVNTGSIQ